MKSDLYLNLCVEQAHLSTLHYRHGCIVVKGGKVIGQGFNDYRPGYDGGSVLKSGTLPKAALPLHDRARSKPDKSKSKFKPVEVVSGNRGGGGHHANARLSMHSEMMAINSALTSSSTLAASSVSHVKPCFKLPGDTKRKRELRRQSLAAYVRAICLDAASGAAAQQQVQRAGKAQAREWRIESSASQCDDLPSEMQGYWSSSLSLPASAFSDEREGGRFGTEQAAQQEVQVESEPRNTKASVQHLDFFF